MRRRWRLWNNGASPVPCRSVQPTAVSLGPVGTVKADTASESFFRGPDVVGGHGKRQTRDAEHELYNLGITFTVYTEAQSVDRSCRST